MPFRSKKQMRYMFAQHPDIARRWVREQRAKGQPLIVGKLAEHVNTERGLARIYGKSKGTLIAGTGPAPAPYDSIPDYASIYYQPDDDPRRENEALARETRRRAMSAANRGKYGFHGTIAANDTPILRYETDDFPQTSSRGRSRQKTRRAGIMSPNRYPQPVKTGPMPKLVVPKNKH